MSNKIPRIKVTSRAFSKHPILSQELLTLFPNSILNPEGPESGIPDLEGFLQDADGMILGLEQIDRQLLQRLNRLKIIAKFGVGLDNLDQKAASDLGISIGWTGGVNKRSVSEQTLGFLLGLSRNLFTSGFQLKQGEWNKKGGYQLSGKCVGVIGCGNVGTDLIHLLQPFHCDILICDLLDKSDVTNTYAVTQVSQDELLRRADIITLHVPLTEQTFHMVDESFLSKMKTMAYLINTSRGSVVKQSALKLALQNNQIAGAALDVYESEPPDDLEFLALPNLMATPHIGGSAQEAVLAMGRSAIQHLRRFFEI